MEHEQALRKATSSPTDDPKPAASKGPDDAV